MVTKEQLQKYCEIRHHCEMWGLDEGGEMLETLLWEVMGLGGKLEDEEAHDRLDEACKLHGLPPHRDIRDET